jgi:CheY-like chemotaxis protein
MFVPSSIMAGDIDRSDVDGDILLYDLDEPFRRAGFRKDSSLPQQDLFTADVLRAWPLLSSRVRLTLALTSHSVSRAMLERMGVVGLLYKPFEMGHLQRYLRVLQRVLLPLEVPQMSEARMPSQPVWTTAKEETRVLVVDDDVDVAQTICQCVSEELGFRALAAYDGLQALEYCLDWQPQCVVTDLIMPWMNGYQMMHCVSVAALRQMPAFVVISALTRLEQPVRRSYLNTDIDAAEVEVAYVDKPFRIDQLLTTIKRVCERTERDA